MRAPGEPKESPGEHRRAQQASTGRVPHPRGTPPPKRKTVKKKEGQVDHITLGDTTPPSSSDRTPQEENKRNNKWEEEVGEVGQTAQESLRSVRGSPRRDSDAQNRPPEAQNRPPETQNIIPTVPLRGRFGRLWRGAQDLGDYRGTFENPWASCERYWLPRVPLCI